MMLSRGHIFLRKVRRALTGRRGPQRYGQLLELISQTRPLTLLEIGVWNGSTAEKMIERAHMVNRGSIVEYFGFDLFECMTPETLTREFAKKPRTVAEVRRKLSATGARINLYKGYSSATLPKYLDSLPFMDFIFIDGGHSLDTIKNDWFYASQLMAAQGAVVFDDYFTGDWSENPNIGCHWFLNNCIDRSMYKVTLLPIEDQFRKADGSTLQIKLALVEAQSQRIGGSNVQPPRS